MTISFGREICGYLPMAENREWLVTNGIGGYASGTIAGLLTRRYHGLLIAALNPPLGRTLLLTKLDETVGYNDCFYPLYTNRWSDDTIDLKGFENIEKFYLEGTTPVWRFACADALIEKRIWMAQGVNTTYIRYDVIRASQSLDISIKALINYRDYHHTTHAKSWKMSINPADSGVVIKAFPLAVPLYLLSDVGSVEIEHTWYRDFDLTVEKYRGLDAIEDHLHATTFRATLNPGESLTIVASTENHPSLDSHATYQSQKNYEKKLLDNFQVTINKPVTEIDGWVKQLVLAADQFIVTRPTADYLQGKTIIAGYPWFSDWGRDTMISLPGLTLATGRYEIARLILQTYARYIDKGMLPNRFPDAGDQPEYNTVDATLWYFEAIRLYYEKTGDRNLLSELFPILAEIIDWHLRGTRYHIHVDDDGLVYAGETGSQLTWMDAKVDNLVITPRIGKPVEISALWYNALQTMVKFAEELGKSKDDYLKLAHQTAIGFQKFWYKQGGYCYDVIDTPEGNSDRTLRPNQIFAIALPSQGKYAYQPLLTPAQEHQVVDICAKMLLTSHGLRSLAPNDPKYCGNYGGDNWQRDSAYHQGTVWGWLLGSFARAHWRVYQNPQQIKLILDPMINNLTDQGVGTLGEIFDGDAPMHPRGCFAQAWTVAEVLRTWLSVS